MSTTTNNVTANNDHAHLDVRDAALVAAEDRLPLMATRQDVRRAAITALADRVVAEEVHHGGTLFIVRQCAHVDYLGQEVDSWPIVWLTPSVAAALRAAAERVRGGLGRYVCDHAETGGHVRPCLAPFVEALDGLCRDEDQEWELRHHP